MRCWQKKLKLDGQTSLGKRHHGKHLLYNVPFLSSTTSKPEREIAVMKRRMGSWGKGQNGDNPERWVLSFHLVYLCCILSLFNLEK